MNRCNGLFLIFSLILLSSFALRAQEVITDDQVLSEMKYYLTHLNGENASEYKMALQLDFLQKIKALWKIEDFRKLRAMSNREILETEQDHPYYRLALAFHDDAIEDSKTDLEFVPKIIEFRRQLKDDFVKLDDELDVLKATPGLLSTFGSDAHIYFKAYAMSPPHFNEKYLAFGDARGNLTLFDLKQKKLVFSQKVCTTETETHSVHQIRFDPRMERRLVFTCGYNPKVHILEFRPDRWDTPYFDELPTFSQSKPVSLELGGTSDIEFSQSGGGMAVSYQSPPDIVLFRWNVFTPFFRRIAQSSNTIPHRKLSYSPDGKYLAFYDDYQVNNTNSFKFNVNVAHLPTWTELEQNSSLQPSIETLNVIEDDQLTYPVFKFSPNSQILAIGTFDGSYEKPGSASLGNIYLWDMDRHAITHTLTDANGDSSIEDIIFNPSGTIMAATTYQMDIHLWTFSSGTFSSDSKHQNSVQHLLTFKPIDSSREISFISFIDDTHFLTIDWLGIAKFWSLSSSPDLSLIGLIDPDKVTPANSVPQKVGEK